jgi:hypothetical protein
MAGKLFYGCEDVHGHDPRLAKAFEEGKVATDLDSCPHALGTPASSTWRAGFAFAHPPKPVASKIGRRGKSSTRDSTK